VIGQPVGEIGGVQQAEGRRRQEVLSLAASRRLPDERRGVPLGEKDLVSPGLEPLVQQLDLGALARAVDPLDDDELAALERGLRAPRCLRDMAHDGRQGFAPE
jgi:hypothetical protein